jgi:hypothetical protein
MKILVANEQEKDLLRRFIKCLHETDSFDDIENNDHIGDKEEDFLSTDEHKLIAENLFYGIVMVDESIDELTFEDDTCITGTCKKCGVQTEGTSDGETISYSEYLDSISEERQKNWLCETCYRKEHK